MHEASPLPAARSTRLSTADLYRRVALNDLVFERSDQLEAPAETVGQVRALEAARFGAAMPSSGFNLFATGRPESQMRLALKTVLQSLAAARSEPFDWVYVNNFDDARRPIAICLPAGQAGAFRAAMDELVRDLQAAIPSAFESETYQAQRSAIEDAFRKQQMQAFAPLEQKAKEKSIAVIRTPAGLSLAPAHDNAVVPPEEFNTWPAEKQASVRTDIEALEKEIESVLHKLPQRQKAARESLRTLDRQTTERAVGVLIGETKELFSAVSAVTAYLDRVSSDLLDNIGLFVGAAPAGAELDLSQGAPFDRYRVNVLVTSAPASGAPIIEETNPTLANLIGSIEHIPHQGALVTNFRLVRPGSIHRANGGYLMLDARQVLAEPFSWQALKRCLRHNEICIEDAGRLLGVGGTVSLNPEPIPLSVKIVLVGDRATYELLCRFDPDFSEHFKVLAAFDDEIERTPETEALLSQQIAALAVRRGVKPLDKDALCLMVETAARQSQSGNKLSVLLDDLADILSEAGYWTDQARRSICTRSDVEKAVGERRRRASRIHDRVLEMMRERISLIETEGERIGQVNGLSVFETGGVAFGHPTRISCQTRMGTGKLIDIEREVELGGPIHSKGVLILSGFLAGRFALSSPMSLQASLVFEQSYAGVEGDSASLAELCCLLSALAKTPISQGLAVTGSINQHGEVQAIGGVNEKIEGFFDLCAARGLTGKQGVIIPRANAAHLMLRSEVVDACAAGRFAIYAVDCVDACAELLLGLPAGERDKRGVYPSKTINRLVEDRLEEYAAALRSFTSRLERGTL